MSLAYSHSISCLINKDVITSIRSKAQKSWMAIRTKGSLVLNLEYKYCKKCINIIFYIMTDRLTDQVN